MTSVETFLTTQNIQVQIPDLILSLILSIILAHILKIVYVRYGEALSNRRNFAKNFILLASTTTLIITIVKSSLALSLGLVGALSIVRFRTAIKEPEELAYLFLNIAIGLGLGANQWLITIIAFIIIVPVVVIKAKWAGKKSLHHNLSLTVSVSEPKETDLKTIKNILLRNSVAVELKRMDETRDQLEASFIIEYDTFSQLNRTKEELRRIFKNAEISYLETRL